MQKSNKLPRGIANNNPTNIRIGNCWWGERSVQTDGQFEEFERMEYGVRAAFIILRRYIEKYQRNNVASIISAWAPASENKTAAYIKFVADKLEIDPYAPIKYDDKKTMLNLVDAMVQMECGCTISRKIIELGYNIAHR